MQDEAKHSGYFKNYLNHSYYPFYRAQPELYPQRLGETINMMLEIELPLLRNVALAYIRKIKQLLTTFYTALNIFTTSFSYTGLTSFLVSKAIAK